MKHTIKTFCFKCIQLLFIVICFVFFKGTVQAQPGTLDSSFNQTGKVVNSEDSLQPYCSALQKDGKIIVGGQGRGVELIRYNADGSKDLTFGINGKVITDLSGYQFASPEARAIAVQEDGKIIAVGGGYRLVMDPDSKADYDVLLVRYDEDGSLDYSFGNNGVVISDFGDYELSEEAFCVALQVDGKIVIGGTSNLSWLVVRFLQNGSLDNSFNETGWKRTQYRGFDIAYSIAIQPDNKIIAAGKTGTNEKSQFIMTRYLENGLSDNSFGVNGTAITNFTPGGEQINSMALQSDGKIIVAGKANDQFIPPGYISVARYQTNGTLDSGFGENGKVTTPIGTMSSVANKVLLHDDKKIIVAGTNFDYTGNEPYADFAVVRYTKDGMLNDHFGDNGIVLTDFGGVDNLYDALLQPDGKIIVVGKTSSFNFAIVRYNGDPTPSPWFAKLKKWLHHHGITWEDKPGMKMSYYKIERSANGSTFNEIARILPSSNAASYHFEDPAPLNGENYYRLSAVSADGSSVTSNIVLVENNTAAAATIKIYPNPAKNNLIIEGLAATGNTKLRITDLYGNILFKATATGNTHTCNIAALKAGTYIITIETGNEIIARKFVKE